MLLRHIVDKCKSHSGSTGSLEFKKMQKNGKILRILKPKNLDRGDQQNLVNSFKQEISKCVLLEDADKMFWLEKAETLPSNLLETMVAFFKEKNDLFNSYLNRAIEADPHVVDEMKNKVLTMKKHLFKFKEEKVQKEEQPEENLEEALKQI